VNIVVAMEMPVSTASSTEDVCLEGSAWSVYIFPYKELHRTTILISVGNVVA
jgi:hypothetical protein